MLHFRHIFKPQNVSGNYMKSSFYINILILLFFSGCRQTDHSVEKVKTRVTFEVLPEDYERKSYTVQWKDTLGQKEGYVEGKWLRRPKEIWCIVTNSKKDTLDYYMGLSTAQDFLTFESSDTIITLNFMIGLNFFSDKFGTGENMKEFENNARQYSKDNRLPIVFEPIVLSLKTDTRKKYDIELKEK